jgi:DnaD/phage-associated family protein
MSEQKASYITEAEEALGMLGKGYNNDPIPATQFISTISGVTPAPDILVNEYGYVTALVWGRVWRHCQMYDGVCRAAVETIAAGIGMSERTITRHLEMLCKDGYLFDMTPNLRNKPHIYADTGKIKVRVSFEVGMSESHSHYVRESIEESTTIGKDSKNIFTLYESNIGVLTSIMADTLQDAEKTYPAGWIVDAITLAVTNNKRNWKYCEAILKRWKVSGKDSGKKEQPQGETVRLL